ncbi:hypothetical protein [Chitinophaga vietnamensis]|uniref:hypothetical protein n=1 Tax=Chitinophaga vietnamensis TaxID=2593957 RepID=UPI001177F09D|nr:hypothetical protein [Chitinophaga vietnamensis]
MAKYLEDITSALQAAGNHQQAASIIDTAIAASPHVAPQLQAWLEQLSPLDWNSTQWSCFRYARIYLHKQYPSHVTAHRQETELPA